MNNYFWTGIHISGKKISGVIQSDNKKSALQQFGNKDVTLLSLQKQHNGFTFHHQKKFLPKHRLDFTQQLHLLLQAGIPLTDALTLICKTTSYPIIQNIAHAIKEKIMIGMNFSSALHCFSDQFDQTYCRIIAAGEQSGQLDSVLLQLIENQEKRLQIQSNISKALFYPISVLCVAIGIAAGLLIFVIPKFQAIYDNFGGRLPAITRTLIAISHHLNQQGILILIILSILFVLIKFIYKKSTRVKNILYFLLFTIPLCRSAMMAQQIARWSQLLAMTLSSGIPLIDALQIANCTITYPVLQTQMREARENVIAGKSLHAALESCRYFPMRAKYLIAIGENADALGHMMKKMAVLYQHNLDDTLDRLSKLLEPVIMITVASVVSGLIIAMYLPIFRMGSII